MERLYLSVTVIFEIKNMKFFFNNIKKIVLITTICCLSQLYTWPGDRYVIENDKDDLTIELDSMYLSIFTNNYYNGMIPASVCTISKSNCHFFRIKSTHNLNKIDCNKIKYELVSNRYSSDSITFVFDLPCYNDNYAVSLHYGNSMIIKICDKKDNRIVVKKDIGFQGRYFMFYIYPIKYTAILPNNTYAGINGCFFFNGDGAFSEECYMINSKTSSVISTILGITKDYFSQFYINGEYIKIESDSLIWRGMKFIKE